MTQPFIGEIRCFGLNFAPAGWAFCNGQLLPIAENDALFALIGTQFGGDGQTNFAVPDLRGRVPIHQGTGAGLPTIALGELSGTEYVTLTQANLPAHTHALTSELAAPGGALERTAAPAPAAFIGPSNPDALYRAAPPAPTLNAPFSPQTIQSSGASLPHDNRQPYLGMNFCIALFGIFPPRP